MEGKIFLKPCFSGERYADHTVPFSALKEFMVFETMIKDTARAIYLYKHKDKSQVPNGFGNIELRLVNITQNCATLDVTLELLEPDLVPPYIEYYEEAKGKLLDTIEAAGNGDFEERVSIVPDDVLKRFRGLSRCLSDNDSIVFKSSNGRPSVKLTKEKSDRIYKATNSKLIANNTTSFVLKGVVTEVDLGKDRFTIQIDNDKVYDVPIEDKDSALAALYTYDRYKDRRPFMYECNGIISNDNTVKSIKSITQITPERSINITNRFSDLKSLEDGWYEGEGKSLSVSGLEWLEKTLKAIYPIQLPEPYIYPTPDGNIQLEWDIKRYTLSLKIHLGRKRGEWFCYNFDTKNSEDKELDLTMPNGWNQILEDIELLMEG